MVEKNLNAFGTISWNMLVPALARLAGYGLERSQIERINTDDQYARSIARFAQFGYDQSVIEKQQKEDRIARLKKDRPIGLTSVRQDEAVKEFCFISRIDPLLFLRLTGLALARAIAYQEGDLLQPAVGKGPTEISNFVVERWGQAVRYFPEPTNGLDLAGRALHEYTRRALYAIQGIPAYSGYQFQSENCDIDYKGLKVLRHFFSEEDAQDAGLLLQLLAVTLCKLLKAETNAGEFEALKNVFEPYPSLHTPNCSEIAVGAALSGQVRLAFEWMHVQHKLPDPRATFYDLRFCCHQMRFLYHKVSHRSTAGLAGSMAEGLYMFKGLPGKGRVYFKQCPFCNSQLFTPDNVEIYDKSKKRHNDLDVWR